MWSHPSSSQSVGCPAGPIRTSGRGFPGVVRVALVALVLGACAATPSGLVESVGPSQAPARSSQPSTGSSQPAPSGIVASSPGTAPSASPTSEPTPTATGSGPFTACAASVLARLSEAQRIGQLFAVGLADNAFDGEAREAIETEHFGSWWFTKTTNLGAAAIRSVTDAIQGEMSEAATGGVGFFVAANQEGGQIQALAGPGFETIPAALEQGTWSVATLRARATRWGRELLAAGVNLDFAPVADVVPSENAQTNAPIGALEREFGFEPDRVASHVAAFAGGMASAGVVTTVKHFPGLGRVAENTDFAAGVVDTVTTADDPYLAPFRRGVEAGVPAVMVSLATYEAIDPTAIAAFSPSIIGGLLRDDLGFEGLVLSDSLSAEAVASIPPGTRAIRFLEAGGDVVVVRPVSVAVEMARAVAARAAELPSFRVQIDTAALRVLRAKVAVGLVAC